MSSRKRHHESETEWTSEKWYSDFFSHLAIETSCAKRYAEAFSTHGLRWGTFKLVTNDHLQQMSITKIGHCIEIISYRDQKLRKDSESLPKQPRSSSKASSPSKRIKSDVSRPEPRLESRVSRVEPREARGEIRETRGETRELRVEPREIRSETRVVHGSSSPIEIQDSPPPPQFTVNGNGVTRGQYVEVSSTTQPVGATRIRYPHVTGAETVFSRLGGRDGEGPIKIVARNQIPVSPNSAAAKSVLRGAVGGELSRIQPHASRANLLSRSASEELPRQKHVTLENPLVTRVGPTPPPIPRPPKSRSPKREKDIMYGSMTADQVEMEQEKGDKHLKNRLGYQPSRGERKQVMFKDTSPLNFKRRIAWNVNYLREELVTITNKRSIQCRIDGYPEYQ